MFFLNEALIKLKRESNSTFSEFISLLIVVIAVLMVRVCWSFTFPVPWNDETAFLGQAEALSRTGSLFVSGLNEERVVMWMPPSYMATLAIIYKIFGYSYDLSRWVSAFFYLGTIVVLWLAIRSIFTGRLRNIAMGLLAVSFISPYGLATANIGRMESMYTFVFMLSLWAMIRSNYVLSLALIIAGATIHFNAAYFLLPFLVVIFWKIARGETLTVKPHELLSLLAALSLLCLYAIYAFKNISGFIEDMRFQFNFKLGSPIMDGPKGWAVISIIISLTLTHLFRRKELKPDTIFTLYGASFFMLALNGHNMWYSHAYVLGCTMIILGMLWAIPKTQNHVEKWTFIVLVNLTMIPLFFYGYTKNPQFQPMWPRAELFYKKFLPEEEITKVDMFLRNLPANSTVSFGYTGVEPFFFNTFAEIPAKWAISGKSVTTPLPSRKFDYRIKCDSSLFPPYLALFDWDGYKRESKDTGCEIIPQK